AEVSVRLLPLLSKRIEVGTVSLNGLRLRLARKASGETNWDDLVAAFSADAGKQKTKPAEKTSTQSGFTIPQVQIGAIEVSDAAVYFHDGASGETYTLTDLRLSTGALTLGEAFPLELGFVFSADKAGLTTTAQLDADVVLAPEKQSYQLSDLALNVSAKGKAVPGGEQKLVLTGAAKVDMKAGTLLLSDLNIDSGGLHIVSTVHGEDLLGTPGFHGQLAVKPFNPKEVMQDFGMQPPATQDPEALTSASLETQFKADLDSASLGSLQINIDESTLKGKASVADLASPAIAFQLALDHMNIDRYLAPATQKAAKEPKQDQPPAAPGSTQIVLEPLENLHLDGRVSAGKLVVSNLKINDAELQVTAENGVLNIRPLGANLYNGSLHMQSTVSAAGKRPSYAIKGQLKSLALGALLKDLIGVAKVAALANMNIDLNASGDTVEQIKRTLDGTVSLSLADGSFHGFDLAKILTIARNRLLGGTKDSATNGKTAFSNFTATFNVKDGLFKGGDLHIDTPVASLGGEGTFNLVTNQLDYTINATIPKGAKGDVLEELAGYTIPISVSGNLFSPSYSLDLSGALKAVAKQKLAEEKAELKEKARNKIQEELSDLLGGDNKADAPAEAKDGSTGTEPAEKKQPDSRTLLKQGLQGLFGGDKKSEAQPDAQ
ncbi:MAG: AsmA family protein, partial [Salinisphaera sp.]|nr:AsmA family protein [Salinisphaera sp.]